MAASTEHTDKHEAGLKKAVNEVLTNVQTRFKDVEKIWNDTFEQLQSRFNEVGNDAREFVKKVEEDGRKRFENIRDQLKVEDFLGKLKTAELFEQGAKITNETIDKLGFATAEELTVLSEKLEGLANKVENVRKRASASATSKAHKNLSTRVAKLEKQLAALQKAQAKSDAA